MGRWLRIGTGFSGYHNLKNIQFPFSFLKCYIMFMEYLRIFEDRIYFSGIILLACPKKGTLDMKVSTVSCLIFAILLSTY